MSFCIVGYAFFVFGFECCGLVRYSMSSRWVEMRAANSKHFKSSSSSSLSSQKICKSEFQFFKFQLFEFEFEFTKNCMFEFEFCFK